MKASQNWDLFRRNEPRSDQRLRVQASTCCSAAGRAGAQNRPYAYQSIVNGSFRRSVSAFRWLVPSAILAVLPKCPACLALYIAMGTGVGLSFSAAATMRWTLILICTLSLAYLAIKRLFLSQKKTV